MFTALKRRFQDARTLTELCKSAEDLARENGRARPASEHFVLAALELPDGTAQEAFGCLSLTKSGFIAAVEAQRANALAAVGITTLPSPATASVQELLPPKERLYQAEPSGQSLVQRLYASRHARKGRMLVGADVLLAVAQEVNSSAGRAFQELGIGGPQLADAASTVINASVTHGVDA